ncbi:MAG: winged helix-turn-helix transcriptional regulator [Ardenticatenales bacterium]|nr:winged helix-turn-helix transcriptional regulator [Ardenticatenales bacterium]
MTTPRLSWDCGTAYDLFLSLFILHDPEKVGLRGAWAAGVRARLPGEAREILADIHGFPRFADQWVYQLPAPKDAATALRVLAETPAEERLSALFLSEWVPAEASETLREVAARGSWSEADVERLRASNTEKEIKRAAWEKEIQKMLNWWANAATTGEAYLSALQSYYEVFYAEEEARIRPALETALQKAQELAAHHPLAQLLELLSQGVRYAGPADVTEMTLIPVFWTTPLILEAPIKEGHILFLFGGRPAEMSLVPGEVVPDLMYQALKALADPTRLRILRYLGEGPLTPTELAHRLRLRAPTVVHHLHTLRLARLVYLMFDEGVERRYALRYEAVEENLEGLKQFLQGK